MHKQLIVAKVGTSSLTEGDGTLSPEKVKRIVGQIADLRDAGHSVVLVTSGSIAAGFRRLGYGSRPTSVAAKQACAAAGQGLLMEEYTRYLLERGYVSAQLLLTRGDFTDRRRYINAFNSMELLLKKGAVPIVNENDTVAVEELKLGDNDTLGAYLAAMLHANLLVLLTDVDGLYTANPAKDKTARRIDRVEKITKEIEAAASSSLSQNGTGGMATKIRAAKIATRAGVPVYITAAKAENALVKAVGGEGVGTLFIARRSLKTRQQWLAFYAQSAGNIYVDQGAADAITRLEKSLLPAGVVAVEGDFKRGDVVCVYKTETHEYLGRGLVNYSRTELNELLHTDCAGAAEAINRDNWVDAQD